MHVTKWMALPSDSIALDTHPSDAVWATEWPSSFNVPSDVRAMFDEQSGWLEIEFRYISPEDRELVKSDDFVIEVGKVTRRVWKIGFSAQRRESKVKIVGAAHQTLDIDGTAVSNRSIAHRVLERRGSKLVESALAD
jgi:hypothetical protein